MAPKSARAPRAPRPPPRPPATPHIYGTRRNLQLLNAQQANQAAAAGNAPAVVASAAVVPAANTMSTQPPQPSSNAPPPVNANASGSNTQAGPSNAGGQPSGSNSSTTSPTGGNASGSVSGTNEQPQTPALSPRHSPRINHHSPNGNPRFSTPRPSLGDRTPDVDPEDELEVDVEVEPVPVSRSFWEILWEKVKTGFLYFTKRRFRWAIVIASYMLYQQMCSVPGLCEQKGSTWVLLNMMRNAPVTTMCLMFMNILVGSSMYDVLEGTSFVLGQVGRRAAYQNQTLLDPRKLPGVLEHFLRDTCDLAAEPVLMLALTFALIPVLNTFWSPFGRSPSAPVQMCFVSSMIHTIKWTCEALEDYNHFGRRLPGSGQRRKPVVLVFLLVLTGFAIWWYRSSYNLNLGDDLTAAQQYFNAGRPQQSGPSQNIVSRLVTMAAQTVAGDMSSATNSVTVL